MPATTAVDVGQEVRAEMGRQRISMLELSRRTEIPRTTLAHQINTSNMSVKTLVAVAAALEVTVGALIGEVAA